MPKVILYTTPDGRVELCAPAPECLRYLCSGGYYRDTSRGALQRAVEWEVERGRDEYEAARFVAALAFGGHTEAEAYGLIRDKDCARRGTAFDVTGELPDRWFRDAWRRSHNGGPISLDLRACRSIQLRRIRQHVAGVRQAALEDVDAEEWDVPWGRIKDRLRAAADVDDVRRVWVE